MQSLGFGLAAIEIYLVSQWLSSWPHDQRFLHSCITASHCLLGFQKKHEKPAKCLWYFILQHIFFSTLMLCDVASMCIESLPRCRPCGLVSLMMSSEHVSTVHKKGREVSYLLLFILIYFLLTAFQKVEMLKSHNENVECFNFKMTHKHPLATFFLRAIEYLSI